MIKAYIYLHPRHHARSLDKATKKKEENLKVCVANAVVTDGRHTKCSLQ